MIVVTLGNWCVYRPNNTVETIFILFPLFLSLHRHWTFQWLEPEGNEVQLLILSSMVFLEHAFLRYNYSLLCITPIKSQEVLRTVCLDTSANTSNKYGCRLAPGGLQSGPPSESHSEKGLKAMNTSPFLKGFLYSKTACKSGTTSILLNKTVLRAFTVSEAKWKDIVLIHPVKLLLCPKRSRLQPKCPQGTAAAMCLNCA